MVLVQFLTAAEQGDFDLNSFDWGAGQEGSAVPSQLALTCDIVLTITARRFSFFIALLTHTSHIWHIVAQQKSIVRLWNVYPTGFHMCLRTGWYTSCTKPLFGYGSEKQNGHLEKIEFIVPMMSSNRSVLYIWAS